MTLADFDALSFDCYGTLIDWEAGIASALRPWAAGGGLDMSSEALLLAYSSHEATAEAVLSSLRDLWPNFTLFVHGGVKYAPFEPRIREAWSGGAMISLAPAHIRIGEFTARSAPGRRKKSIGGARSASRLNLHFEPDTSRSPARVSAKARCAR